MRTDFFVASFSKPEGEGFVILQPAEIPKSFFFPSSEDQRLRDVPLLSEEEFCLRLKEMGLSADEIEYQRERARGQHISVK